MIALILAATVMAATFIPWAARRDRDEYHTLHTTGCPDCADDDEWLGL